jgi:hypothetical protein
MSVAGIASSAFSQLANVQRNAHQVRGEFKQLSQDLQAGNLTKAQTDFVTLSQSAATQFASNSPTAQALNLVGQALQSGDISSAQQALASVPIGKVGPSAVSHHSHVPPIAGALSSTLTQLGGALQSGNLSAAQQAFKAVQQSWQQMSSQAANSISTGALTSGLSVTA